jgi:hypothetical protein
MKTNIFEQSTTTTTTASQTSGYGAFEQNTNRMSEAADARLAYGFKYEGKTSAKRIESNVVGGAFVKATQGQTCVVYFRDGSNATGDSKIAENLPNLSPNSEGPSGSNGMLCKTETKGNYYFYNKNREDFLQELKGYTKQTQEKTTALETQLDNEETEALKFFTPILGGMLVRDYNALNQVYQIVANYIVQQGGQSIYFGYLKSAINAQMKILNRKRADNQKLGKTLSSVEEDLWANYKKMDEAIPEKSTTNPVGYTKEQIKSVYDEVPLTGYPFDILTPFKGIPFIVYVPHKATKGAEVGKAALEKLKQVNLGQSLTPTNCIEAFEELSCLMRPFNDRRFNQACTKPDAQMYEPGEELMVKSVKDVVAGCLASGLYDVNKNNIENSGKDRGYLRMINNDFFAPGGAFNNAAIPCAYINTSAPTNGQSIDGCLPRSTAERTSQKESYSFKNNVHKLLTEAKEIKKKEILENEIIETRFVGILESIENVNRKTVYRSVGEILSETKKYVSKNYDKAIIQENLQNVYKFITALVGDEEEIKDMFVKKTLDEILVKKLGMDASDPMTIEIINKVSENIDADNIPDMITDCHYLTVQIADAIPTAYANKLTTDNNGFLSQFQNVITGKLQDSDTSKKLISMLSGPVCETLNGIQSTMDEKIKGYKHNLFQKN